MIGTIYVRCNASHPEVALPTMASFVDSPSSIRILDVPKKIGIWQITSVQVKVTFPDEQTHEVDCRQVASAWVGTLPASTAIGESRKGFMITASGTDENGNAVEGYVLGVGDVSIIGLDGKIIISEVAHYLHFLSAEPENPEIADTYEDDGIVKIYTGDEWISLNDMSGFLQRQEFSSVSANFLTAECDPLFSAVSSNFLTSHQPLSDYYTKSETSSTAEISTAIAQCLPLSGGTLTGDVEFASDKSVILPMDYKGSIPQFTYSLYGRNGSIGRYYHWLLKTGRTGGLTQTIANMSDVEDSLIPKLDAEEYTPTRVIPLGLYYENDPSEVVYTDLFLENDGEFTEGRNRYYVRFEEDGVYVKCSYARQTRKILVENLTTGESTKVVNDEIWFDIGDVGEIADGDDDTENLCVMANVTEILPTVKLTVGQSIENRLENYYTKTQTSSVTELQTAFGNKADKSSLNDLSSSCIRRNANTITTAGTTTDYLINSSLAGGVRIRWSSTDLNNYTSYGYRGLTARRNGQSDDYILDNSANGIARFKDISAVVEAYLAEYGVTRG